MFEVVEWNKLLLLKVAQYVYSACSIHKIFSMTFLYILALSKQLIKHGIKITLEKELFLIILTSVMAVSIFWYFESMMSLTNLTLSAHIAIFSQCLEVFWNKNKPNFCVCILKIMHFLFHLEYTISFGYIWWWYWCLSAAI